MVEKISAQWMSRSLSVDDKRRRFLDSREILELFRSDRNDFIQRFVKFKNTNTDINKTLPEQFFYTWKMKNQLQAQSLIRFPIASTATIFFRSSSDRLLSI